MRYFVYFEVSTDVGNRLDFEKGGPGKIIGEMMNLVKPEAAYIKAGTRTALFLADLNEATRSF